MNTPLAVVILRRAALERALERLPPVDLKVLLELVARAHPATCRAWTPVSRLSEDLGVHPWIVGRSLERLAVEDFIEVHSPIERQLGWIDLAAVLAARHGPPDNLPTESPPRGRPP